MGTAGTVINRELDLADGELLLVRKPEGWTSFDVVNKIRHLFGIRRVGHAGTLDPMATGLLIVCTGKRTKEIDSFVRLDKEYRGTMVLGARTPSYDGDTPVVERRPIDHLTPDAVRATIMSFAGPQLQVPPMYSAVKVGGKPLYKLARQGREVERKAREIVIRAIQPTRIELPEVDFTLTCSKGTYVRTLVDDIGRKLGCGAYLRALERTRIAEYSLDDAVTIDDLVEYRRVHN